MHGSSLGNKNRRVPLFIGVALVAIVVVGLFGFWAFRQANATPEFTSLADAPDTSLVGTVAYLDWEMDPCLWVVPAAGGPIRTVTCLAGVNAGASGGGRSSSVTSSSATLVSASSGVCGVGLPHATASALAMTTAPATENAVPERAVPEGAGAERAAPGSARKDDGRNICAFYRACAAKSKPEWGRALRRKVPALRSP